jgi:FkbM family methyltransferase
MAACKYPDEKEGHLALYGAGDLGRLAIDYLRVVGCEPVMALDANAGRHGLLEGVPVLHPQETSNAVREADYIAVSIVGQPYVPIQNQLVKYGYKKITPFYDLAEAFGKDKHPLSNGWFAPILLGVDYTNTCNVITAWSDATSRAHHLQFIAWRRTREEWSFEDAPIDTHNRYFIPEVVKTLHDHEVFVDVGAYHGNVSMDFINLVDNKFKQIIAIEPDSISRALLEWNLREDPRVTIHDFAVTKDHGVELFHNGLGYASQIARTGKLHVTTKPLDSLRLAPTFIKMHLEGGEYPALRGARYTLFLHRPIVAVTVYHNMDGFWKTPLWLMDHLADYKFYFRLHSWCGTGAVVYAIPNERVPNG